MRDAATSQHYRLEQRNAAMTFVAQRDGVMDGAPIPELSKDLFTTGQGELADGELHSWLSIIFDKLVGDIERWRVDGGRHIRAHAKDVYWRASGHEILNRAFFQTAAHDNACLRKPGFVQKFARRAGELKEVSGVEPNGV